MAAQPSILILGGGLIGLSIAEHLLRRGVRPTVLERGRLAREASWASSGFLDLRVAAERNPDLLRLTRRSLELYPAWAERLERDSGIDPELLHSSSLDLAFDDEELSHLEALAQRLHQKSINPTHPAAL
jgi:glycine oxidase